VTFNSSHYERISYDTLYAGNEEGVFEINSVTGVLRTVASLDREEEDTYVLTIQAMDSAGVNSRSSDTEVSSLATEVSSSATEASSSATEASSSPREQLCHRSEQLGYRGEQLGHRGEQLSHRAARPQR
jgi:hypothetical protein